MIDFHFDSIEQPKDQNAIVLLCTCSNEHPSKCSQKVCSVSGLTLSSPSEKRGEPLFDWDFYYTLPENSK